MVADYRMETRSKDGTYKAWIPFRNLQGEWFLNKADQIRFDIPIHHPNISYDTIYPARDEIWVYRNNTLIFSGPLWDMTASSDQGSWTCSAGGLESYLDHRRIDWDYNVKMAGADIAWDMINQTQALTDGQLYITRGTVPTTPTVSLTHTRAEGAMIFDEIDKLAQSDEGFDWEINPATRAFNAWSPRKDTFAKAGMWFDKDNGGGNLKSYSLQIIGEYSANDVLVSKDDKFATAISGTNRPIYGLMQYSAQDSNAATVNALSMKAQYIRNLRQTPKLVPGVVCDGARYNPFDGDCWFGDRVPLYISDGSVYYNQDMRCAGIQATVDKNGGETFVVYLNDLREVAPDA